MFNLEITKLPRTPRLHPNLTTQKVEIRHLQQQHISKCVVSHSSPMYAVVAATTQTYAKMYAKEELALTTQNVLSKARRGNIKDRSVPIARPDILGRDAASYNTVNERLESRRGILYV